MDLIDDFQQNKVEAEDDLPLLRVSRVADRLHRGADRGAGRRAGHARAARAAQRDHGDEGRRHQRLPRRGPGAGHGSAREPAALRHAGVGAAAHQQGRGDPPQRDQGPAGAVLATSSTAAGCSRATGASTTSTTSSSSRARRGSRLAEPGRGRRLHGLRLLDLRRGPEDLAAARAGCSPTARALEPGHPDATSWSTAGAGPPGRSSAFHAFQNQRVRAIGRDPGGEIEPPSYFKREEKPSDTMGFGELRRLHRLSRVARLRRRQAARAAAPQARLPDGRPGDDAARRAVLVRRRAPRARSTASGSRS